ncbi:TonB-dependent receptor domain-containing protein [Ideonella sp. BN130291]|uniref:TonB-dependent receptor domain-containing protein n=1 Tax=Ideonella sp. BN130291 TaxID=3112940 RepID=UPI002E26F676|nr:TonB-dependent receptor [Ideonella sp. BN130291]
MTFPRSALSAAACSLLGLVSFATTAFAQAGASGTTSDTVIVTATRQPTRIDAQLSDVSVITREDIERSAGRTLAELLGQQPGLQFIANGGLGKSSSVSIRGAEVRHTLLLIDGVRYGSATLGQATFENIPLESIDRIEIVRGPMSSLYGADAVGGVIQVFTREGSAGLQPNASVGVGSHRYSSAGAGIAFGSGPWTGNLQLQHQRTRGFSATNEHVPFGTFDPDDDGFRQTAVNLSGGYRFNADWQLKVHALRSQGRTQYDDGPGADTRADLTSESYGADLQGTVLPGWRSTVRLAQSMDASDTLASASPFTELGTFRTTQQQLAWENSVATPLGSLLVLAEHLRQKVSKPGQDYAVTSRTIDALALGVNGRSGAHTWQASVRHDRNSQFGSENTGNLAYGFDITPAWRVGGAVGSSFSAPSFNQLYYPDFGDPTVLPERGRHRELSLRWRADEHQQLTLTAYSNRVRDYIDEGSHVNGNIPTARMDGATLAYEGRIAEWTLAGSLDELRARDDAGEPLRRKARHGVSASADRQFGRWSAGAVLTARSSRRDTSYDDNFNAVPVTLPKYALLDLRAEWQAAPDWTVQARLNNVANRQYETAYGYNQPGRELYLTLRWAPR